MLGLRRRWLLDLRCRWRLLPTCCAPSGPTWREIVVGGGDPCFCSARSRPAMPSPCGGGSRPGPALAIGDRRFPALCRAAGSAPPHLRRRVKRVRTSPVVVTVCPELRVRRRQPRLPRLCVLAGALRRTMGHPRALSSAAVVASATSSVLRPDPPDAYLADLVHLGILTPGQASARRRSLLERRNRHDVNSDFDSFEAGHPRALPPQGPTTARRTVHRRQPRTDI